MARAWLSPFVFIGSRIFPFRKFRDDRRGVLVVFWDDVICGLVITNCLFGYAFFNVQGFGDLFVTHAQKAHLGRLLGMLLIQWDILSGIDLKVGFYFSGGSNWLRSGPPFFTSSFFT